eukprot:7350535-Prymnesium_polylepis.2
MILHLGPHAEAPLEERRDLQDVCEREGGERGAEVVFVGEDATTDEKHHGRCEPIEPHSKPPAGGGPEEVSSVVALQPMKQAAAEGLLEAKGADGGEASKRLGVEGEEGAAARLVEPFELRRCELEVAGEPAERHPHERQGGERDRGGDSSDEEGGGDN